MSTSTSQPLTRRERRALDRSQRRPVKPQPRPAWRSPFVLVTLGAVALMGIFIGALLVSSGGGEEHVTPAQALIEPPTTGLSQYADGEALGPADAPVVLEVYADYQCPWCGRFARETLPTLARTFVATGQLRIEERAIAFLGTTTPDESLDAAAAAACAAPAGKYWAFADYLMWNQSGENQGAFSRDRLAAMANRIGLDAETFRSCLDNPEIRGAIQTRTAQAFASGIQSTPTFVLDGERLTSSYDELAPLIQERIDAVAAR
jgi:protein-disulfide isomerase